jgi:two-component sensor histidine kinase
MDATGAAERFTVAEQSALLREVHHRVGNNLQMVCSLLCLQMDCINNAELAGSLNSAHSRVMAMSLVHQQVYRSPTLASIDLGSYIEVLSDRLFEVWCPDPGRIRIRMEVEEVLLDVDQAVACGLILNELLSNALQHAFADGREGLVKVSLKRTPDDCAEITVVDDGIGLPAGDYSEPRSLGMQLVRILIRQLHAELSVSRGAGTRFGFLWKLSNPGSD